MNLNENDDKSLILMQFLYRNFFHLIRYFFRENIEKFIDVRRQSIEHHVIFYNFKFSIKN